MYINKLFYIYVISKKASMRYLQYFIYLIILKRNNAKDILTEIKEKYNKKLTYNYIYRKLDIIRKLLPK